MKNTKAIDKIISELAMQDYLRSNPVGSNGLKKNKKIKPYSLSPDTNDARQVKIDYVGDRITEEEYKTWCLRWNLNHGSLPSKL
jgi:hypothetical protein